MSRSFRFGSSLSRSLVLSAAIWLFGACLGPAAWAQEPEVDDVSPTSGSPGTLVTLYGDGFAADFTDHWAFVHSPAADLGVVLEPTSGTTNTWSGILGPAGGVFTGSLVFWAGNRSALPAGVYVGESGVYLVQRAEWFVRSEVLEIPLPGTFTVTAPTSNTVTSEQDDDTVVLEVPPVIRLDWIDLSVTIDGGQTPSPVGPIGSNSVLTFKTAGPVPEGRAFRLLLQNLEPKPTTAEALARDLEVVVEATFGVLGVEVEVLGAEVRISWTGAPAAEDAFGVLRWEP